MTSWLPARERARVPNGDELAGGLRGPLRLLPDNRQPLRARLRHSSVMTQATTTGPAMPTCFRASNAMKRAASPCRGHLRAPREVADLLGLSPRAADRWLGRK